MVTAMQRTIHVWPYKVKGGLVALLQLRDLPEVDYIDYHDFIHPVEIALVEDISELDEEAFDSLLKEMGI